MRRSQTRSLILTAVVATCFLLTSNLAAQKRSLDHQDFVTWNDVDAVHLSNDGSWISYEINPNEGDGNLCLYHVKTGREAWFPRGKNAIFSHSNSHMIVRISPPHDTLKEMRRRGVKDEDLPGDSLVIYNLTSGNGELIADVKSFKAPEKYGDLVVFTTNPPSDGEEDSDKKKKKYSKKNGYLLVAQTLSTGHRDTLDYVTDYEVAREGHLVIANSKGRDSTLSKGIYILDNNASGWQPVKRSEGKYSKLTCSNDGMQVAFMGDLDTTEALIRPFEVFHWKTGLDSAEATVQNSDDFIPEGWIVSGDARLRFSDNGERLFFGLATEPVLQDTSLLDEEIVNVEVWHYLDKQVYTQQNVQADRERKRSYLAMLDLSNNSKVLIANQEFRDHRLDRHWNSDYVLLSNDAPYQREMSWKGYTLRDVAVYDMESGTTTHIATAVNGSPNFSPQREYAYWYNRNDSLWHTYSFAAKSIVPSKGIDQPLYNELQRQPDGALPVRHRWLDDR